MKRRLLAVFAHPDDEAFGPAGTLALYAKRGVEIHLLCATSGEAGEIDKKFEIRSASWRTKFENKNKLDIKKFREKELLQSAQILGSSIYDYHIFIFED